MRVLSRLAMTALLLSAATPVHAERPARSGEVTAVSLRPGPGRADLVISLRGEVTVREMTLNNPLRLVLDLHGTSLAPGAETAYDGVNRAGIRNVRIRQYEADIVRVVLDLDQMPSYRVEQTGDAVRLSFGTDHQFSAWSTGTASDVAAVSPEPAPSRALPEVSPPAPALILSTGRPGAPAHRDLGQGQHP